MNLDEHDVQQGFVRPAGVPLMLVVHNADGGTHTVGSWNLPGGLVDNYKNQESIGWHAMLALKCGATKVEIVIGEQPAPPMNGESFSK